MYNVCIVLYMYNVCIVLYMYNVCIVLYMYLYCVIHVFPSYYCFLYIDFQQGLYILIITEVFRLQNQYRKYL